VGPFDEVFQEAMDHLWSTSVKPAIDGLRDELDANSWVQSINRSREKNWGSVALGSVPSLIVGLAPNAPFLAPAVIEVLTSPGATVAAILAAIAGVRPLWEQVSESRARRQTLEAHSLFYLHQIDQRFA
jgi:hypothetical protein